MFKWLAEIWHRIWNSEKFSVVASSYEQKPMPKPTDVCVVENKTGPEVEYLCGHRHAERFTLNMFGETFMPKSTTVAKRKLCSECQLERLKKVIIRCAACGFVIWPGEGVAVYADSRKFNKDWKTTIGDGKKKGVIGCLRWDCCPSGGFFAGHWMGDHFESAFEGGTAVAEVFRTGKPLIIDNIDKKEKSFAASWIFHGAFSFFVLAFHFL